MQNNLIYNIQRLQIIINRYGIQKKYTTFVLDVNYKIKLLVIY